jgi:hypothetical protein
MNLRATYVSLGARSPCKYVCLVSLLKNSMYIMSFETASDTHREGRYLSTLPSQLTELFTYVINSQVALEWVGKELEFLNF